MRVGTTEPDADVPPSQPSPKEEIQAFITHLETDPSFLQEMLAGFLSEAPQRMANAGEAFSHGDISAAAKAAHSLVSMLGAVRATSLAAAARKLEDHLRKGALEQAEIQLEFLEKHLRDVIHHVAAFQRDRNED